MTHTFWLRLVLFKFSCVCDQILVSYGLRSVFFVSYVFLRNRKKTKTNYLTTKMKRKNAHLSLCVVKCLMLEIFKLWTDFLQEKNWQKLEEITKHNYVTAHTLIYYKITKFKCSKWHKTAILTSYVLQVISAS